MQTHESIFSKSFITASVLLGAVISIYLGYGVYARSRPNYNSSAQLDHIHAEVGQAAIARIENTHAIGSQLSSYNKKIANARLLMKYQQPELAKLNDPYLISIREKAAEFAGQHYAILEYGKVVAATIGLSSILLTTAVSPAICWPFRHFNNQEILPCRPARGHSFCKQGYQQEIMEGVKSD